MAALPSIADRSEAHIVIFDGHCRFCTNSARRLNSLDWRRQLSFISLHEPEVAERWPDLTHEMLMEQMYVVDTQGNRYGGSFAFRFLCWQLPLLWILLPLVYLPFAMTVGQWGYRKIAQQRYRWGRVECTDNCKIHFNK